MIDNAVNGGDGIIDIEGKGARVAPGEPGQRSSFNGGDGIIDIEGKGARVAPRMEPRGRERHGWAKPRGRYEREHMSQSEGSDRVSMEVMGSSTWKVKARRVAASDWGN